MGAILTEEWETGDCQLWFIAPLPAKAWAGENTIADNSDSSDTGTETETASSDSSRPGDKLIPFLLLRKRQECWYDGLVR